MLVAIVQRAGENVSVGARSSTLQSTQMKLNMNPTK